MTRIDFVLYIKQVPYCQLQSHLNGQSHTQMLGAFVTKFKELQSENAAWKHQNEALESEIGVLKGENKDLTDQLAAKEKLLQAKTRNLDAVLQQQQRHQEQGKRNSVKRRNPPPPVAVDVVKKIPVTAVPVVEPVNR